MEKPLILLTNDDGIDSPYLAAMAKAMREELLAEVLILAPERQRSAMSHTITLHKPLRVEEKRPGAYAVSGSPVDCVYIGVLNVATRRPSLVVSGPNDGFNLGTDVFYSGTVGAAMEGGLRGIPSISVSIDRNSPEAMPLAAGLVCRVAEGLMQDSADKGTVLNINVPAHCEGRVRWTRLGKRFYEDDVHERKDPRNRSYYWIGGGLAGIAEIQGSDCEAVVGEGIASITPLHQNLTDHAMLGEHEPKWQLGDFKLS
jgi:5'-nucleotidase